MCSNNNNNDNSSDSNNVRRAVSELFMTIVNYWLQRRVLQKKKNEWFALKLYINKSNAFF